MKYVLHVLVGLLGCFVTSLSQTAATADHRVFAAVLLVRGTVAGGNVGPYGVYVRNGNDTSWTKVTKSNLITFGLGFSEHKGSPRHYIAAGNGVHRSTDGGVNWRVLTGWTSEEILCVVPDPIDSSVIYAATPFGVFKSVDDGATWARKIKGLKKWFIQRIVMDQRDHRTLYAASEDDVYVSKDSGEEWLPLNVGKKEPLALLQNPALPNHFLAGFEDGGIRFSHDNGETWNAAIGLDDSSVYTFTSSADGMDLYAAGWKTGLWRSEDQGATWTPVWEEFPCEALYSVCVNPQDSRHLLIGSVGVGVYESFDRGRSWKRAGLFGAQVKQIEFYP